MPFVMLQISQDSHSSAYYDTANQENFSKTVKKWI